MQRHADKVTVRALFGSVQDSFSADILLALENPTRPGTSVEYQGCCWPLEVLEVPPFELRVRQNRSRQDLHQSEGTALSAPHAF